MAKEMYRNVWVAVVLATSSGLGWADDDRVEHFEGKSAQTIEQALENLRAGNLELAKLLATQPMDTAVSYEVHQLTYTLENALERLEDELERTQEILERVHLASEANQGEIMTSEGLRYLALSQRLFGPPAPTDQP